MLHFSFDGRIYRSRDNVIVAHMGTLLVVPATCFKGDLREVVDGCPVPWDEFDELLRVDYASLDDGLFVLPQPITHFGDLIKLIGPDWRCQPILFGHAFVHLHGIRFACTCCLVDQLPVERSRIPSFLFNKSPQRIADLDLKCRCLSRLAESGAPDMAGILQAIESDLRALA